MRPVPSQRRGNAAATIAALIPILGFLALVVDVGMLQTSHSELQAGVDAAALAGAGYLDGTTTGMATARKMAIQVASMNTVRGKALTLTDQDVLLGYYDAADGTFVQNDDPQEALSVFVQKDVTDIESSFAGTAFGQKFMQTSAHAISNRTDSGVGRSQCFLPIAIPDCYLTGENVQPFSARMTSANNDNAGWSDINRAPSASSVRDQLLGTCSGVAAGLGDTVYLNNGQLATAVYTVEDLLEHSATGWNTTKLGALPPRHAGSSHDDYGKVVEGPVIIFHPAGGVCGSATQFNQAAPIVGFAWATIYDVRSHGVDKTMWMYVDPSYGSYGGIEGGGMASNYTFSQVGLVY